MRKTRFRPHSLPVAVVLLLLASSGPAFAQYNPRNTPELTIENAPLQEAAPETTPVAPPQPVYQAPRSVPAPTKPAPVRIEATRVEPDRNEDRFALNFVNADITAVVRAVGSFTNQTYVVDPRVRGTISLVSPEPLTRTEARNALLAALRLQGFTMVESGGISKVVPENDAKIQAASVDPKKAYRGSNNAIVTQVFQLNYESATAMVPVLRPLIAPNNTIAAYPNNNTLVITDYADNLQRIARIIASIDGPASADLQIVPLEHALAVDLAAIVNHMLDESARGAGVDSGQRLTVMADPRSNSLLLRSPSKARMAAAKDLITRLDTPTTQPGNVWVVYLKNAEAPKLAKNAAIDTQQKPRHCAGQLGAFAQQSKRCR
ncbi:MAG: hypothetical protein HC848_04035 [Limnobacter sp.]|nr:hypothetical protein [Limnobacter sp.]